MQTHKTKSFGVRISMIGALVLAAAIATPVGLQSCQVTHNSDGSWTGEISPDVAITAQGLEDALKQLVNMLNDCTAGYSDCTPEQLNAIANAIDDVLEAKKNISRRSGSSSTPGQPKPPPPPQPG